MKKIILLTTILICCIAFAFAQRPNLIDNYLWSNLTMEQISLGGATLNNPTDLEFHSDLSKNELWVINKDNVGSGGSTVTVSNFGMPNQIAQWLRDGNAVHFMNLPTAIAFGDNGNWANAPGVTDANHTPGGVNFTGPTLWSSDLAIYAQYAGPGTNGSHLDMLHASPECQGIAWETGNVYWVFDGYNGDVVRYDFAQDHGPGQSYHGDGRIRRYSDVTVSKDANEIVVSHMDFDAAKQWLYVVDNDNQRVFRMDITTGAYTGAPSYGPFETLAEYSQYGGYVWEDVVTAGLVEPAGIYVMDDRMLVSDYSTGDIIVYEIGVIPAVEIGRISTGDPGIQGIEIGPTGEIFYVNSINNGLFKVAADSLNSSVKNLDLVDATVSPNPAESYVNLTFETNITGNIAVSNVLGQTIYNTNIDGISAIINVEDFAAGLYLVNVFSEEGNLIAANKFIKD